MKKDKTAKDIVDEIEAKLQDDNDNIYANVIGIGKNGRIYLPYIELLLDELVEFLLQYLGKQYFEKNPREANILSTVAGGIEEIKSNQNMDTVTIIQRLKVAMNQSRYIFLDLLELSIFNGLVFDVFDEFYSRYQPLLEYITLANADYKKLFFSKNDEIQVYVSEESLLQMKRAEKRKEQSETKQKEERLWKSRFSNLHLSPNENNVTMRSSMEKNDADLLSAHTCGNMN